MPLTVPEPAMPTEEEADVLRRANLKPFTPKSEADIRMAGRLLNLGLLKMGSRQVRGRHVNVVWASFLGSWALMMFSQPRPARSVPTLHAHTGEGKIMAIDMTVTMRRDCAGLDEVDLSSVPLCAGQAVEYQGVGFHRGDAVVFLRVDGRSVLVDHADIVYPKG